MIKDMVPTTKEELLSLRKIDPLHCKYTSNTHSNFDLQVYFVAHILVVANFGQKKVNYRSEANKDAIDDVMNVSLAGSV